MSANIVALATKDLSLDHHANRGADDRSSCLINDVLAINAGRMFRLYANMHNS